MYRNNKSRAPGNNPVRPGPSAPLSSTKKHINRHLCRTTEYKPPGSDKVGLSPTNQPSKFVWELPYSLNEKKYKELSQRFPGIAFVMTGFDSHDHPIAHTSYRVVWENVLSKLKPGSMVADISGNPDHNEKFNKNQVRRENPIHIDTFCKVMSTKDSIRCKTRWGPKTNGELVRWEEMTLYDMYRNTENKARFAAYDVFLLNHSIYYYTFAEINQLMQLNPNAQLVATLHKLEGQNGLINCGEQSYEKDFVTGKVKQVNVDTGEFYQHPDPAPWFQKFSYADVNGAIAWTVNKGCDDTYVITLTSTQPGLVPDNHWHNGRVIFHNETETIEVTVAEAVDQPPAYTVKEVVLRTHDFLPGYGVNKELRVQITHPELYASLRNFMINKPRSSRTLVDLTAKAHRDAGNNTLLGNNTRMKISSDDLTRHIAAAWSEGSGLEAEMFKFAQDSSNHAVNRNLASKSINLNSGNAVKQVARFVLAANSIVRSKEPVQRVLEQLDDLL